MIVLGIDTSTVVSSVCLGTQSGPLAHASLAAAQSHAEFLAPAIDFCLRHSGTEMRQVAGVAVGVGPGLYTGMRVGLATARSLAHALRLPCVGLASLDLVAFDARWLRPDRIVCPVLDARRGELFWAVYRPAQGGVQRVTDFRVGPPERLAGELEAMAENALCVGDGALAHRGLLESAGAVVGSAGNAYPDARSLVELAVPRFLREETQRPEEVQPIYLRSADARISWKGRGALYGGTAGAIGEHRGRGTA